MPWTRLINNRNHQRSNSCLERKAQKKSRLRAAEIINEVIYVLGVNLRRCLGSEQPKLKGLCKFTWVLNPVRERLRVVCKVHILFCDRFASTHQSVIWSLSPIRDYSINIDIRRYFESCKLERIRTMNRKPGPSFFHLAVLRRKASHSPLWCNAILVFEWSFL